MEMMRGSRGISILDQDWQTRLLNLWTRIYGPALVMKDGDRSDIFLLRSNDLSKNFIICGKH